MNQTVLVVDFGGQYDQLIARRVRDEGVYASIVPATAGIEEIRDMNPIGLIFTGGPASVNDADAPQAPEGIFGLGVPILGICYGAQVLAKHFGGSVTAPEGTREYGGVAIHFDNESPLFAGCPEESQCWMSHTDTISVVPPGFDITASTDAVQVAAFENAEQTIFGVQFHPEVEHTPDGKRILHNFLYDICGAAGDWNMKEFAAQAVADIQRQVGDGKVLLALSGGVDSSVCASLIHKAIGDNLTCVFVNTGLMRKDEPESVRRVFEDQFHMNLISVDAVDRYLQALAGVTDPEQKRKIIGEEFIRVFEEEAQKLGHVEWLAQGTIYPDIVESGKGDAALIKSHHNVGGLPEHMDFEGLVEPLRDLFKDEVRALGEELGLPKSMVWRQPFPGPGLAIRVLGEVTREKLDIVRDADAIVREEVANADLEDKIWQYFAVLTNMRSVGVMGDERTYEHAVAIRAITSTDAMTADWARIPDDVLAKMSSRIVNEVPHVNRVLYDITTKPPATIEYE